MASLTEYLWFSTKKQRDLLNITQQLDEIVARSGVREGFCLVSAMHITASIWVNDHEPGLWEDFWELIEQLAPERADYKHHNTGEDNGDAHLKRTLVGHQALLPVTNGKLDLGPWEQVFYVEFDGGRRKRVVVKVLGEELLRLRHREHFVARCVLVAHFLAVLLDFTDEVVVGLR